MSDLISRSELTEEIKSLEVTVTGLRAGKGILSEYAKQYRESVLRIINEQPTAYDVEKVVEQIRSEAQLMSEAKLPHKYYKAVGSKKARDIIRKGGVNERD